MYTKHFIPQKENMFLFKLKKFSLTFSSFSYLIIISTYLLAMIFVDTVTVYSKEISILNKAWETR